MPESFFGRNCTTDGLI